MKKKEEKTVRKMKATKEKNTIIEDPIEIKEGSDFNNTTSKGIKNIPNPHLARNKNKTFREDTLQIENKREIIIVPVILDLLTMRSQYFNDLFSSLRKDNKKRGLLLTIPEDQPLVAAELIIELHKLVPDFSEWNYQWVQLSEKWQMQQVCDIYRQLCANKLTKMLHTLKNMDMMNSVLIVMNCENSEAVGVYQYQCADEEIYYVKKVSSKEEYRIFRQKVYSASSHHPHHHHNHHHNHPQHHHHHHPNPMHDEESVSIANSFLDDEDSSSESDFSVGSPTSLLYSPTVSDADMPTATAWPVPVVAGAGTNHHQTNPTTSSVAVRVRPPPKSVWCHGLFSTNATGASNEFSLNKVLFARSKPSSSSSSNANSGSKASRGGSNESFSVEDQWTRVNERYNGLSMNAKMKVLTLGCQRDSGINLSMPAFSTTSSTSSSSSSSSSSNPPLPSSAVNISTTSITPTATSSSNPNPNPNHTSSNSSSNNNNSSSKRESDGEIIDVKIFWELARYWLRGIDRPNLGDVATESELMDQVWEYKDILLREQIQDAVISVLGKRKRPVSP